MDSSQLNPLARPKFQILHWRSCAACRPPRALAPWLADSGSLTRQLTRAAGGEFRVELLRQQVARVRVDEARALGLERPWALVREVLLYGRNRPWVFARSVIPLTSLRGRLRALKQLDNRPLGQLLFADPGVRREPLQLTQIAPSTNLLAPALRGVRPLWARRSVFRLAAKPLLVSEVFLADFNGRYPRHSFGN